MKVIEVKNISKSYTLGTAAKDSIIDSFRGLFQQQANEKTTFHALKDISFDVHQGEVLGIVGKNGAGKSTLLKVLSRITEPTNGEIIMRGRVASLLEVGTGFHPELTGRENIFLNGSILGMTRTEIKTKFDEIVAFSGVEKFIDTPVKHYSSGMYVRLAFSVAAHLEPEILIIDEVLAVGDAEFQKKCLGKMKDVAGEGRTVLFVSHNMAAVKSLCSRAILLNSGLMLEDSDVNDVISRYIKGGYEITNRLDSKGFKGLRKEYIIEIYSANVNNLKSNTDVFIEEDKEVVIELSFRMLCQDPQRYHITYHLLNEEGEGIFSFSSRQIFKEFQVGLNTLKCHIPGGFLQSGNYTLKLLIVVDKKKVILVENYFLNFTIIQFQRDVGTFMGREPGHIRPKFKWTLE